MSTFASKASLSIHVAAMEDVCVSSERRLGFDLADMNLKHDESGHVSSCFMLYFFSQVLSNLIVPVEPENYLNPDS